MQRTWQQENPFKSPDNEHKYEDNHDYKDVDVRDPALPP